MTTTVTISDFGNGLWILGTSMILLVILINALPGRYFRWRVSKNPAELDKITQLEFDWCWNLTAIVVLSSWYGLLWAMNAITIDLDITIGGWKIDYVIPAFIMLFYYIAAYLHTGRHLSKPAIWAFAGVIFLSFLIGFAISIALLDGVPSNVLNAVYGNANQVKPGRIDVIYALLGWFFAPDFYLYLFLTNFVAIAAGFVISQIVDAIIRVIKLGFNHHLVNKERKEPINPSKDTENLKIEN